ncbi:MAG: 23S rRNA (pseudouridine(1915)-N(3))-methyltransferase RlmH [Candidatus Gracilibacteria bacterium]|nr:23S rRNA (pseudouridine(1915)-N(3))-methyltransferase RlmH [Candidatus Gracilibacteria bacterium]
MKIKIWFFGKKSEITDFEREMLRRIEFRCDVSLHPLLQAGIDDPAAAKKKEAEKLLSKISETDFLVVFDEHGKKQNSVEFAHQLRQWLEQKQTVHFLIGGAHGLDQKIISRANFVLSFGAMVWTRNLFRQMALEQIYRALEIEGGSNFHKK